MLVLILRSAHAEENPQSTNERASQRSRVDGSVRDGFALRRSSARGRSVFFGQTKPGGKTNLWLWETIAGSPCLFPACSLQGTLQRQRVERRRAVRRVFLGGVLSHARIGLMAGCKGARNPTCGNFEMAGSWR
jgi:hypothetical protein